MKASTAASWQQIASEGAFPWLDANSISDSMEEASLLFDP
jgi:hypothetical protein